MSQNDERACAYNGGSCTRKGCIGKCQASELAALANQRAEVPQGWREQAAGWLRQKADEQERINSEHPAHAAAYPSWVDRVRQLRWLAEDLLAAAPEAPAVAQMSLADAARHFPNGPFGQPRIAAPEAPAQRCPYCDDTGDVHTPTGEWRGRCTCPAGTEAPAQAAQSAGEVERGDVVAFEFYNRATGHAIVDYSVNTHVGNLSAAKGYEARPLVYAAPRQNVLDGSKLIPAWQAREALDELEAAARGDAPFNHQAAAVVRAALASQQGRKGEPLTDEVREKIQCWDGLMRLFERPNVQVRATDFSLGFTVLTSHSKAIEAFKQEMKTAPTRPTPEPLQALGDPEREVLLERLLWMVASEPDRSLRDRPKVAAAVRAALSRKESQA